MIGNSSVIKWLLLEFEIHLDFTGKLLSFECLERRPHCTLKTWNMDYRCSMFLAAVVTVHCIYNKWFTFRYFVCTHIHTYILYVKSIYSRLAGIKACTLLKCSTRATICKRAGCCGIGLFARRAAGSGPLKGWVPSLNKAWEMPARPRVTNGQRETWTCYHEEKKIKRPQEQTHMIRMHTISATLKCTNAYLQFWIDGRV